MRATFAAVPALAAQPWLAFLILFVQTMFMTMIINGIASMGEEFGWRAYLLQKLMVLFAGTDGGRRSARKPIQIPGRAGQLCWSV